MILVFPSLDAFRLALTTGLAPPDLTTAPASASIDAGGRLFVETDVKLTKKVRDELDRLGVTGSKRHPTPPERVTCWLQVVPLTRNATPPQFSKETPVLFELPAIADLPTFVGEMLRLGNDRQAFRIVADASGHVKPLLRVIGPPYYTLLRAIDKFADAGEPVRAYVEAAPRVWVEVGHTHPMAAKIAPADGQLVLLRGPREWTFLADEPYRDVYELLNLQLPATPAALQPAAVKGKVTVPLRLAAGNAADRAELWIVRGSATDEIDTLVRDADDRLIEQLRFAVATTAAGERVIVLRTVPSKKEPPALPLEAATGFKPFWKLPNLYVPAGTRLHPTIRRDAVRSLLAPDPDQLVWLFPGTTGAFIPETVAENSFRPLADWVEYVIDTAKQPLAEWIASATFTFDTFVCTDAGPPKAKPPAPERRDPKGEKHPSLPIPEKKEKGPKKPEPTEPTAFEQPAETKPPSVWRVRRDELEKQFLDANEPLDGPTRIALWPQLAEANAGIGESARDDAAVCWVNALWTADTLPREYVCGWVRSERPDAELSVTPAAFDRLMVPTNPTPAEIRAFAATLLLVSTDDSSPNWLRQRLPAVQKYLETHDRALPVRAVWLVASRLAALGGADVLGLARVRDRILQRLLEEGLSPERDLPGFLRFAGLANSERVRVVRERAGELHRVARAWVEKSLKKGATASAQSDVKCTLAYTDLMFAFGFARLGEPSAAQAIITAAQPALVVPRPPEPKDNTNTAPFVAYLAGGFLFHAFKDRIEACIAGKPHTGQLGPTVLAEYEAIQKKKPPSGSNVPTNPYGSAVYAIDRMREQSKILDPQEKLDPYLGQMGGTDEFIKAIHSLPSVKDPGALARTIRELLQNPPRSRSVADARFAVLHTALQVAGRVGEAFTLELLALVPDTLRGLPPTPGAIELRKQGELFDRSLFLAAHFDRVDVVQRLVDQFVEYVRGKPDEQRFELVNVVAAQCLRSLRKLGLREEIDKLLRRTQDEILKGKTLTVLKTQYASRPEVWLDALQTLLNLAAGYLTFGLTDQALPILDAARAELAAGGGKVPSQKFARLAQAYITAVGQGPAETGLARILDLYSVIDPARVVNGWMTAPYYSRLHLSLIEDTVLAVGGDEFGLGSAGRRWLDEDELLVRRRVHADMRRQIEAAKLT